MTGRMAGMDRPTPLTIIGGFLGAGKTTLLRRILAEPEGRRLGVAINDFGALNIDELLVAGRSGPVVSLANGCVCCQIGDSLIDALFAMRNAAQPPDGIVVEASGVADPGKIAQLGRIGRFFRLNSIAVVVDADNVLSQAADPLLSDTMLRQLRAADLLLLNKIDLVDDNALRAIERWLAAIVPDHRAIKCVNAAVPVRLVLDDQSPSLDGGVAGLAAHDHADSHEHARHQHHGDVFWSWSYQSTRSFGRSALLAVVAALPSQIIRGKGILICSDQPARQTVLHLVGRRVELSAGEPWHEAPSSRLVLIGVGQDIDGAALTQAFNSALR
ncbi:MAG: GTP-binding protein [Alphaproteobacteria bacterium]|nr:GTP-binding protein [Alphaproteobacteria bacterium]